MKGEIAYVPQQAWIFHGTVRDNITFGMPFDQKKFDQGSKNKFKKSCFFN